MLHVKIDLMPNGREEGRRTLHDIYIANDEKGDERQADYEVWLDSSPHLQMRPTTAVREFRRADGPLLLVALALGLCEAYRRSREAVEGHEADHREWFDERG